MITVPDKFRGRAFVKPDEAAEILGLQRSGFYRQVYGHVRSGTIQSLKIGGCRRILLASLLTWAERELARQAA